MRVTAAQGLNELRSPHDSRSLREQSREERFVKLGVQIGTAVGNDDKLIIVVACVKQRGQDYAARSNAEEYQCRDISRAKNHFEVRSGERIDPVLRHDDVVLMVD